MKQAINLVNGTVLEGKWNKNKYKIIRMLGSGAIGQVYLVTTPQGLYALKLSEDTMSITSEVTVLKRFSKVQGSFLGPFLFDIDDVMHNGKQYYFYVMEYISGELLLPSVKKRGYDWAIVYIIQLLKDLELIHEQGFVFGDLKPENILISDKENRIRFLDVGGTTLQGRAVKEYTEFFDRGYWELGGRKAEPSYDLFAVGMILINMAYPNTFTKGNNPKQVLKDAIQKSDFLRKYEHILQKALFTGYTSCKEMREDFICFLTEKPKSVASTVKHTQPPKMRGKKRKRHRNSILEIIEILLLLVVVIGGYAWYIYYFL